jgi:hypothetical protein
MKHIGSIRKGKPRQEVHGAFIASVVYWNE